MQFLRYGLQAFGRQAKQEQHAGQFFFRNFKILKNEFQKRQIPKLMF